MKLAIMQPYFFPYIGYFSLIKNTDFFVFFDTPQYIRKGWINRNRIIGGDGKAVYITVPVMKAARETAIKDICINNSEKWREKIRGQLSVYKRKAPFYNDAMSVVEEVISSENASIAQMAMDSVEQVCRYLGIKFPHDVFSKMPYSQIDAKEPDEWALNITKEMGYDTYVNPPGGKSFFHAAKYEEAGIQLQFLTQILEPYNQRMPAFAEGLSIIDLMMFCKPEDICAMMNNYIME